MFIQMACSCGAEYQADTEDQTNLLMVWAQSFINSHTDCGYMTKPVTDKPENMRLMDTIHKEQHKKEL